MYAYLHSPGLVVATALSKRSVVEHRTEEPYSKSAGKNAEHEIQIHPWCTKQAPFLLQTATFTFTFNHLADAFIQNDVQMRRTIEAIRPSREQQYTSRKSNIAIINKPNPAATWYLRMHTGRLKEQTTQGCLLFYNSKMFKFTESLLLPPKM